MSDLKQTLLKEFEEKEYAHAYMHAHLLERLAAQIYNTRTARGLSQDALSHLAGVPQAKLSKLESAEVSSFSLTTLLKVARALDVSLDVSLEDFSRLASRAANVHPQVFVVASREQDVKSLQSVNALVRPAFNRTHDPIMTVERRTLVPAAFVVGGKQFTASVRT